MHLSYKPDTAFNAEQVLEILDKPAYELAFSDCIFQQKIRQSPDNIRDIVAIARTAKDIKEDTEKCLETGMNNIQLRLICCTGEGVIMEKKPDIAE